MNHYKFGFIGSGNIANAIISGQIGDGNIKPENIFVFDIDEAKTVRFVEMGAVRCDSASDVVKKCDFIFLTVKPQIYPSVLNEIKNSLNNTKCIIDVGAGITIDYVKSVIGCDIPVIRVMPNTPLMIGEGAAALCSEPPVTDEQMKTVFSIFDSCGVAKIVSEGDINTVTSISGSSPAFIFKLAKEMISAAVELGMDSDVAATLISQTIVGSGKMLMQSGMSADELIKMVASPNGTTVAGLNALDENKFGECIKFAVVAAKNRADELAK